MSFDAKAIGFFKPFLEDHLHEEDFRIIPSCFEKTYGITLSDPISLRLPNGAEWRVSWTKHDNDILFQEEDWKRFAQFCSFKDKDLLIFKYEGGSIFQVWIFDPHSTCLINHSSRRTYDTTNGYNEVENDDCVEIHKSTEMLPKKRKIVTNRKGNSSSKYAGTSRGCVKAKAILKHKDTALDRASNLKTTNNPYFTVTMSPSYLRNDYLVIPRSFANEYLDGYEGIAIIGVSEDRTLPVKIRINKCNNQSSIYSGWNLFCKVNKLELSVVCHFEKTDWAPVSFKITIIPDSEDPEELEANRPNQDKRQRLAGQKLERRKRKRSEGISRSCPKTYFLGDSEGPNMNENKFKLCIKSNHLQNGYPYIPPKFLKKHPRCHRKYVKLQVGEKLWPVKVVYYPISASGRFSAGWADFARGCKLKDGNICEFDMIDDEKLVFKVSIS